MIPDDVVCFFQRRGVRRGDQLVKGSHKVSNPLGACHTGDPIVTPGDDAQQAAGRGPILGDGNRVMTGDRFQVENVLECRIRTDIRIRSNVSRLICLYAGNHRRFVLNRLRTIDEGDTALLGQRNRELFTGNRLHDRGDQRNIHRKRAFFLALAELDAGCTQADVCRRALSRGITGNQQIFAKGMRRFFVNVSHYFLSLSVVHPRPCTGLFPCTIKAVFRF